MFLKKCCLVCPRWETWKNIDRKQCFRHNVSWFTQGLTTHVLDFLVGVVLSMSTRDMGKILSACFGNAAQEFFIASLQRVVDLQL